PPNDQMLFASTPATILSPDHTRTAVGPPPHTLEPRVASLIVGACTIGPIPHSQPFVSFLGVRKMETLVGAEPNDAMWAGAKLGFQTRGTMVRVMMFQSSLRWIGMTGSISRTFCVPLWGPTPKLVKLLNGMM